MKSVRHQGKESIIFYCISNCIYFRQHFRIDALYIHYLLPV
jgi:hypothetical protein